MKRLLLALFLSSVILSGQQSDPALTTGKAKTRKQYKTLAKYDPDAELETLSTGERRLHKRRGVYHKYLTEHPGTAEVKSRRSRNAVHIDNADGTYTVLIGHNTYKDPDSGNILLNEPEVIETNGGWRIAGTGMRTTIRNRNDGTAEVRMRLKNAETKKQMFFTWILPTAVTYEKETLFDFQVNGLPWQIDAGSAVQLKATVDSRRGPREYRFQFEADKDLDLRVDAQGTIVGTDRFHVTRPAILRADARIDDVPGGWRLEGNEAVFSYDDSALPDSAFPYVIDPSATYLTNTSDNDDGDARKWYNVPPGIGNPVSDVPGVRALTAADMIDNRSGANQYNALTRWAEIDSNDGTKTRQYVFIDSFYRFNTSTIPAGTVVTSATFSATYINAVDNVGYYPGHCQVAGDYMNDGGTWTVNEWLNPLDTSAGTAWAYADMPISMGNGTWTYSKSLSNPDSLNRSGYTTIRLNIRNCGGNNNLLPYRGLVGGSYPIIFGGINFYPNGGTLAVNYEYLPQVVSVNPYTPGGSPSVIQAGSWQNFDVTYRDPDGYGDLSEFRLLINYATDGARACYPAWRRSDNANLLATDTGGGGFLAYDGRTWENSQCWFDTANSGIQSQSGTDVVVRFRLKLKDWSYGGATFFKNVYVHVYDNTYASSGWVQFGQVYYNYPPTTSGPTAPSSPLVVNTWYTFSWTVSDTNGAASLGWPYLKIGGTNAGSGSCFLAFDPGGLYLRDDADTSWAATGGPRAYGGAFVLSNSQCDVDAAGSSRVVNGTSVTLSTKVRMKPAYAGTKYFWTSIADQYGGSASGQSTLFSVIPGMFRLMIISDGY